MSSQSVTLPIYGLGCGGSGVYDVERVLTRVPGVGHVYVNPATEMAYVSYDPAVSSREQLDAAIEDAGFGPPPRQRQARLTGEIHGMAQLDPPRLALATGIVLAGLYVICLIAALLIPSSFQIYHLWELALIGVRWNAPWTLALGLAEVLVLGGLVGWALATLYNVLPDRASANKAHG